MDFPSWTDLDRICTASLAGRFGVRVMPHYELSDLLRRQRAAGAANDFPGQAVRHVIFRRFGTEQGTL